MVLLGDFNARVGRSVELDDVIGMFGEDTCNASGNRLVSFLNEVEMVVCNGRKFMLEPEWTRVRPSLKQKSIIDYIITDPQLMAVSGNVHVDNTDIGCSDHFLVWMELGRTAKNFKEEKRVQWNLSTAGLRRAAGLSTTAITHGTEYLPYTYHYLKPLKAAPLHSDQWPRSASPSALSY